MRSPLLGLLAATVLLTGAPPAAHARTAWVSVGDLDGGRAVCLDVGGRHLEYTGLATGQAATVTLQGPRRLKLIARYMFAATDDSRLGYTVTVTVDGREALRKTFTARPLASVDPCGDDGLVSALRKGYLELPAGQHTVTMTATAEGQGSVAVRLFRQVKRTRDHWMSLAPADFGEVRELEFASGNRSAYYTFDHAQPLRLQVHGPTRLRVRTRLDFDHVMNGSQNYTLEVCRGGEVWRTFHFDATRLETAVYVDRPDILPGSRREFTITVPRGDHELSIRCVRPQACGVAASVDIPRRDLER